MSQLTNEDVRHLATLSNLELSDEEVDSMNKEMTAILGYVEQLDELDTTGVKPTYQVTGLENVWRSDEVVVSEVDREKLLALSPDSADNQVKVPKVL